MSPLFRRHKDEEDPFASLKPASEDPFEALEDREDDDVEVRPAGDGGGRGTGVAVGVLMGLVLLIGGVAAAVVIMAFDSGEDEPELPRVQTPTFPATIPELPTTRPEPAPPEAPSPAPSPGPEPQQPAPTPARPAPSPSPPAGAGSMVRQASFRRALGRLPRGSKILNLRLAPERLDVTLLRGNRLSNYQVRGNDVNQISAGGGAAGLSQLPTFPISGINAAAPERMIRAAGASTSRVNYLVFVGATRPARWLLYLKNGRFYQAGPDGRGVSRVGG